MLKLFFLPFFMFGDAAAVVYVVVVGGFLLVISFLETKSPLHTRISQSVCPSVYLSVCLSIYPCPCWKE